MRAFLKSSGHACSSECRKRADDGGGGDGSNDGSGGGDGSGGVGKRREKLY